MLSVKVIVTRINPFDYWTKLHLFAIKVSKLHKAI